MPPRGRAGGVDVGVERDGDDLDAGGCQLLVQRLPPGQVEAAPSPRRPGDEDDLAAADARHVEGVAVEVLELELGHARRSRTRRSPERGPSAQRPCTSSCAIGMPSRWATTVTSNRPSVPRRSGGRGTHTSSWHAPSGLISQPVSCSNSSAVRSRRSTGIGRAPSGRGASPLAGEARARPD